MSLPYAEFLDRLFQHVPLPGFRMVRYYGLYGHLKDLPPMPSAASQPLPEKLHWRELQIVKTGEDPLVCPTCGCDLVWTQMAFPGAATLPLQSVPVLPRVYADTS